MKLIKDKTRFESRTAAPAHFNRWEAEHPIEMRPEEALSGPGAIYELIADESRQRVLT